MLEFNEGNTNDIAIRDPSYWEESAISKGTIKGQRTNKPIPN